ncbi:protein LpqV [Mycolicibacterium phlei]|jgi:hypothetical protein|uniref:Protein LpqV n=1 Tax=Mycolicibacterium phlei DSM 43239 = CCUG 21000 TaxID=1226750 RepID=A0A5N5V2F3_MYCPH|nr:lipoprotein LpqV [Mycolicibacterium phlei]VEG11161.1 protein LpqV [Mycobacteroides chelonae]AMO63063.1 hypothetical protein MPHLCCUG_04275 [Mycolicibacterium phlei]EID17291.1 protein LpqV [Mycolicibacterium phlei RIVM601174]KAB7756071.1 protein LpqV [Mycolicibacterium phlei DSM 43239 = CCUG 21000]KXW65735.1 protein LpqV [Mycolicibacterium phlei DSM 43239 = CCUG 21000]
MRRYLLSGAAVLAACLAAAGCASDDTADQPPSAPATDTTQATTTTSPLTRTAAPGTHELSPDGVTTAVGAPAESTEEEYFQACFAARTWMEQQGGDLQAQIEPYLAELQRTDSAGPGTFGTPWSQLPPPRQAAVIVAVEAAAAQQCG